MPERIAIRCSACKALYALPASYREQLEGRAVACAACDRWWVPVAAVSGPPVRLVKGRPERSSLDLGPFRHTGAERQAEPGQAETTPAGTAPMPTSPATEAPPGGFSAAAGLDRPLTSPEGEPLSLRVVASGPETDVRGTFDLGAKAFLIGRRRCHLNLPLAGIPERAIRIFAEEPGFSFEGVGEFTVPLGPVSVRTGQIEPGSHVELHLEPYRVVVESALSAGSPIAELEQTPTPVAPSAVPGAPAPSRRPPSPSPAADPTDIRELVQEVAVDERPDQQPFAEGGKPSPEDFDADMTITDIGARGFQASRVGDPLKGAAVRLVRAEGANKGKAFAVTKTSVVIGRKEGDLIIRDRRVSSKHAQLDVTGPGMYTVKDLASTNGTTINGRTISIAPLRHGDVVGFGGVTFEFIAKEG